MALEGVAAERPLKRVPEAVMSSEHRVIFTPSGLEGRVESETTVLDAARQLGVDLDSVCGGRGICGRCQVIPALGQFPKWAVRSDSSHLSASDTTEGSYAGKLLSLIHI